MGGWLDELRRHEETATWLGVLDDAPELAAPVELPRGG
ncbi:hypothetical protein Bcav_4001 [Beutenbergia cavernae DSM 12333]|uniref:Uncharacterized protein n=1 Tax=Beutenbergia cavernae (strain ATCC BAA-8 / DSM 12333 / CCUG 43141 / JCM 11478 / NBRC 16432 / NCIMB 13614 / HKI 0122) TaxID=471853 RepID=C5C5A2_BEUC1|nr:hypothetical protein Bcav_4001 [Beutenbergia cavernae DSM 12333]